MRWLGLVFAMLLLVGCERGPVLVKIQGTASFERELIADGNIRFVSTDPHVVDAAAPIVNGKYEAEVQPGDLRVVITATREEGEVDPVMGAKNRVPYIPQEYSSELTTILQIQVKPEGERTFDFHLEKSAGR